MSNCPFVSYFRAYTNIFTGFSILAVDFKIYPQYFYKSRVFGTALMDSGLGFYIISNAIVSAEARGIETTKR
jgi:phosphatidylinositol glycan class W